MAETVVDVIADFSRGTGDTSGDDPSCWELTFNVRVGGCRLRFYVEEPYAYRLSDWRALAEGKREMMLHNAGPDSDCRIQLFEKSKSLRSTSDASGQPVYLDCEGALLVWDKDSSRHGHVWPRGMADVFMRFHAYTAGPNVGYAGGYTLSEFDVPFDVVAPKLNKALDHAVRMGFEFQSD